MLIEQRYTLSEHNRKVKPYILNKEDTLIMRHLKFRSTEEFLDNYEKLIPYSGIHEWFMYQYEVQTVDSGNKTLNAIDIFATTYDRKTVLFERTIKFTKDA